MNTADIVETIKASKKYGSVCGETIERIARAEAGKYGSDKEIIKSVKTRLHQISGAFIGGENIKEARRLIESSDPDTIKAASARILSLHASSSERMSFVEEIYRDIFAVTGAGGGLLDIACGFNPFSAPLTPPRGKYFATDINTEIVGLINDFFVAAGIAGQALASDILYRVPETRVGNVLLFKILPLLERQEKGSPERIVRQLNTEFVTITFPTRSLSGRNHGMYRFYGEFMAARFPADEYEYCLEKEYPNELLFIIRRK